MQFYSDLYTSECSNDSDLSNDFFKNLTLPTVSNDQNAKLSTDITIPEIITAIKTENY